MAKTCPLYIQAVLHKLKPSASAILGTMRVTLQVASGHHLCEFHVVRSLSYKAVLGRDFLRANGTMIDLRNGTLQLDDKPAGSHLEGVCHVRVWSTSLISPNSEAIIQAGVDANFSLGTVGLLETSQKLVERYHVQGAASLVTLSTDHTVPFRLINPTC